MQLPEITDQQIDRVVAAFGIECDQQRHSILKHRDSVDVRACAGSGKTTLLVAKLALVLERWTDRLGGVCILSHTNVAHEEIRRKFAIMPQLRRLEVYPHHLGTIQSFVNTYLGVPGALARFGVRPVVVDDEQFAARALRILQGPSYATARGWLSRQHNGDALVAGLRLCESEGELVLESAGGNLPSVTSTTGAAMKRLKDSLIGVGVFRYDDMDAIGQWYAKANPTLLVAARCRFPVVFLDEAQDTSARQAALLDFVFGTGSVVQRFGDDRQAIFRGTDGEDSGAVFPKPEFLSMSTSLRLSPTIAGLAEHACIGTVERLTGRANAPAHRHTVFAFSKDKIGDVLAAFAELVAVEIGCNLPATRVMAIGFRRHGGGDAERVPEVISDYWAGSLPQHRALSARFGDLSGYLKAARCDVAARNTATDAHMRLLQAACRMLELQAITQNGRPYTPARLLRAIKDTEHRHAPALMVSIGRILLTCGCGNAVSVESVAHALREGLKPVHGGPWNQSVMTFCAEQPPGGDGDTAPEEMGSDGIFRHPTPHGQVQVGLSTVHGVKGETMDATLVLSTYFHTHDLQQLIDGGPLRGQRPTVAKARQARFQANIKRIYVAMTRPTRLLCLAIRDDHVTDSQRREMEALGWRFQAV